MITYRQPFKGEYPITQDYGVIIPGVTYKNRPHSGIDYGCPSSTEILAAADGVVKLSTYDSDGYGKYVIIQHSDGNATLYAHLCGRNVTENQKVKQGDVIGWSGNTGNSTGPHLHFEARRKWGDWDSHFDPRDLPLMSFDDTSHTERIDLKGADAFQQGDLVKVQNELGVKGFYSDAFDSYTTYLRGQAFYYAGDKTVRKSNGLTYMRVVPASFSVWVAVNDGETQILDK